MGYQSLCSISFEQTTQAWKKKKSLVLIKTSFVLLDWPVIMRGTRVGGYVVSCPLCRTPSIFAQSTQLSCSESPRMCDYNICVINHSNVTFCVVTPRCCRECSGDRFLNKLCAVERSSLWILLPERGDRIQCPAFQMPCAVCAATLPKSQVIKCHWSAPI